MFQHFVKGFVMIAAVLPAEAYAIGFNALLIAAFAGFNFADERKAFLGVSAVLVALEAAFLAATAELESALVVSFLSAALAGTFELFLLIPRAKKANNGKKEKTRPVEEFVRSIDRKLRMTDEPEVRSALNEKDIPLPILTRNALGGDPGSALSISHARDIIERLDCIELTPSDRARVREAEYCLGELEKDGCAANVLQINDKLSSLIKILAKYEA